MIKDILQFTVKKTLMFIFLLYLNCYRKRNHIWLSSRFKYLIEPYDSTQFPNPKEPSRHLIPLLYNIHTINGYRSYKDK